MVSKKPVMSSEQIQRKEYKYSLGPITLNFTLRTDVKLELVSFKELLTQALRDIENDIKKLD